MIRQAHEPGTNHNPTTPTGKRKLQSFHESNEPCDIDSDLSSDEERQLIHLVECSERKDKESTNQRLQPQDHFMTPIDRRRYDPMGGLPTPETGIDLTSGQSESKRRRLAPSIPSPARSTAPDKSSTHGDDYDITEEVMTLLGTTPLRDTVRRNLRETLNRYALRMRGIERGRELSRASLKTKDNRIAELQQRVATLENERKADRRHIRALGRGLEALYGDEASDTE
ncbi:hypothetical protein VTK73DRAFT_5220 [Phialemonium thermophilum]|uniref:Uncharacterized protein n=1 Tax=Phialemonium thermophilum TaxID=223376 RepID=A0ABR3WPS0_9PEZI